VYRNINIREGGVKGTRQLKASEKWAMQWVKDH